MALTKITSTNIQPGAIQSSSLETSGAAAGTYGSASLIPVLSVNAQGIVYAISETTVAGVTNFSYNSGTEVLTISTADGGSFTADVSSLASQTYVDTALANLIDSAPGALDTLNELAAAIGDDANFAATVTNSLATKVDKINITGATVGSSTQIPVITYNAQGQITSTTTTAVAGIDSVTFTNGTLTIAAGDGTNYTTDFDARYFTETEANSNFLGINAKAADADLFDGLNSTQFLRSDTSDSMSGNLTITGVTRFENYIEFAGAISTPSTAAAIYRPADNQLAFSTANIERVRINSSGILAKTADARIGSDVGAVEYGTSTANSVRFYSADIERVRIDSSGNVGIGTQSPAAKLHIAGTSGGGYITSNKLVLQRTDNALPTGMIEFQGNGGAGGNRWQITTDADVSADFGFAWNGSKKLQLLNNGYVGINDNTPSYHLDVNGTIRATGDVISDSDRRLKSDIKPISNALKTVQALSGKAYIKDDKASIGLIAQEVEEVMPFMVHTANDEMGTKSVNYQNMVALLIEAVKEQQEQIDELKRMLENK
jgi:hypothetical protein